MWFTTMTGTTTKIVPGANVGVGRDHTLYALSMGKVAFDTYRGDRTRANVEPLPILTAPSE